MATRQGFRDRLATRWRVMRAAPPKGPRALAWRPPPRGSGSPRRGRQIAGGLWHFAGQLIEAEGASPWDIEAPSIPFEMQLHGMGWIDDVMATGDRAAIDGVRRWVMDWIRRYGTGTGPGWTPALTGRRLLRWISHAPELLHALGPDAQSAFFDSAYRQAGLLRARWHDAPSGLPRTEALTGLLYAGLTLEGMDGLCDDAAAALTRALAEDIGPDGGIASRNPEALLEVATLLGWAIEALAASDRAVPEGLTEAQGRVIPTLRALRHADGGLARFHGGGRGREGRLDRVLATSGIRARNDSGLAMGFVPMSHGRTTIVVDAEPPPTGRVSGSAHASTLAFEMTSGGSPVIVNCGPGGPFGPDWHRAGRATASHSTLIVDGWSSSRIGPLIEEGGRRIAPLIQTPRHVQWQRSNSRRSSTAMFSHDGYVPSHGLTHLRRLILSTDGRLLEGEDGLRAIRASDKERFDDAMTEAKLQGIPFQIRFHLHPDAQAELDLGGRAVSITLPSGEVWVFRPGREVKMTVDPSVHLEPGRLRPRASTQVVLTDRVVKYAATIDWTLTRAQEAVDLPPSPAEGV
ncbi:heparinase II/III family protein [Jannaschia formosa]|uniref:heparinase II/III family protein n=1 Tax=Jannaschia formosa TaxID=2259592 RepID=UPI000E1BE5B0|nr:heparinase II/III family protein [Jannaschia formosa]TFL20073.1 heparinase [Jannaschia formosa]